jgi:hypothetical protein
MCFYERERDQGEQAGDARDRRRRVSVSHEFMTYFVY